MRWTPSRPSRERAGRADVQDARSGRRSAIAAATDDRRRHLADAGEQHVDAVEVGRLLAHRHDDERAAGHRLLVGEERHVVAALEPGGAAEERQLDHEAEPDHLAADALDSAGRRPPPCRRWRARRRSPATRSPGATRVGVDLEAVGAVLELVLLGLGGPRELPGLAHRDEPGPEPVGHRAPRSRSRAPRCRPPCRPAGRRSAPPAGRRRAANAAASAEQRGDVLEADPRLREVGDVADQRGDVRPVSHLATVPTP